MGDTPSPDRTAKMALFVDLGFVRFVSESRPSSLRYPTLLRFGDGVAIVTPPRYATTPCSLDT
jgi:hypothetical protein